MRQGPAAGLHRADRGRGEGTVRRVRRQVGRQYPAIIRLWENAWSEFVPFLDYDVEIRRVICTHQRHRVAQRPLPAGSPSPRALPHRTGRAEVPLPGHPVAGPDRQRQGTMGNEVEARPERLRHHLRQEESTKCQPWFHR